MVRFEKYSANGNDFIVIDNREQIVAAIDMILWERICQRRTGIGADGVLLLENSDKYDFKMRYVNSDGVEVSMCGNGARSITHFAHSLNLGDSGKFQFETMCGVYDSEIVEKNRVRLNMSEIYDLGKYDLSEFGKYENSYYINTGVPHAVFKVADLDSIDVQSVGSKIRSNKMFNNGVNVNFYKQLFGNTIQVRSYERGVEDETLSCGTGAVASAIAFCKYEKKFDRQIIVLNRGGELIVDLDFDLKSVWLVGDCLSVFEGSFSC